MKYLEFAGRASVLAMAAMLSACGGGGGSSGGVASTPTPPPVTYTKIADMTGNRTFKTLDLAYRVVPTTVTQPAYYNSVGGGAFGSGTTVAYNAATDTYTLTARDGTTESFDPTMVKASTTPNTQTWTKAVGTKQDRLLLIVPTNSAKVALSYTVVGIWNTANLTSPPTNMTRIAIGGAPTVASDMPKTGTAAYDIAVSGSALSNGTQYTLDGNTTGTMSADFGAGSVTVALLLAGTPGGSTVVSNFGTYNSTAKFGSDGISYSGGLTGPAAIGSINGAFFGPQALETGFVYDMASNTFSAIGFATGIKK